MGSCKIIQNFSVHVSLTDNDPLAGEQDMLETIDNWRQFLSNETDDIDFSREKTMTGRPMWKRVILRKGENFDRQDISPPKTWIQVH